MPSLAKHMSHPRYFLGRPSGVMRYFDSNRHRKDYISCLCGAVTRNASIDTAINTRPRGVCVARTSTGNISIVCIRFL